MAYQYYNPNPYQNYMMQNQYQPQMYQMPQQVQSQMQMPVQQQMQMNQVQHVQQLNGQMVDSVEAVKAKDVDLTGNPVFYPNVNGLEIYKKQLMADGTSKIVTYKAIDEDKFKQQKESVGYVTTEDFNNGMNKLKEDIISEIKKAFG